MRRLASHNGLRNPDRLHVGQTLDLAPLFNGGQESRGKSVPLLPSAQDATTLSPAAPRVTAIIEAPAARVEDPAPVVSNSAAATPAPVNPAPLASKPTVEVRPIAERQTSSPEPGRNRGKVFRHVSRDGNAMERLAALKAPEGEKPFVLVARDASPDGKGGPAPDQLAGMSLKHYREPGNLIMAARRVLHPGAASASTAKAEALAEVQRPESVETKVSLAGNAPVAAALHEPARITSGFGMRRDPFNGRPAFHRGVDLAVKSGTDIYPVKDGVVKFSGWQPGYGRMVIVQHDDGLETVYAHTSSNLVQPGERVSPDSVIAKSGSSGRSTGPHLHFEVRQEGKPIDPMPHLHQH